MTEQISGTGIYQDLAVSEKYKKDKEQTEELGQKAFLKLMITQLENQDPLSPQENSEFIAQLAQFSSVESLDQLNNNFDSFTESFVGNQALQASNLVGRSVTVPSEQARLEAQRPVSGLVDVPASTGQVALEIFDDTGALVDQINLGSHAEGEVSFSWDGSVLEVNGRPVATGPQDAPYGPGVYRFVASASIDGEQTRLETSLSANVNSVTVGQQGLLTLNLEGVGPVSLKDVKQFNE